MGGVFNFQSCYQNRPARFFHWGGHDVVALLYFHLVSRQQHVAMRYIPNIHFLYQRKELDTYLHFNNKILKFQILSYSPPSQNKWWVTASKDVPWVSLYHQAWLWICSNAQQSERTVYRGLWFRLSPKVEFTWGSSAQIWKGAGQWGMGFWELVW